MSELDEISRLFMREFEFHGWQFLADPEKTRQLYELTYTWGAEHCKCVNCRNFVLWRDQAYPADLGTLLDQLGINRIHEKEVDHYGERHQGKARYLVEYYFVGVVLDADATPLTPVSPWKRPPFTAIDPETDIYFSPAGSTIEPLVLLECYVWVPWTIQPEGNIDC